MSANQQLQQIRQQQQAVSTQLREFEGRLSDINQRAAAIDAKLRDRAYSSELARAGLTEALATGDQAQIEQAKDLALKASKEAERHRLDQGALELEAQALRDAAQQITSQAQTLADSLRSFGEREQAVANARLHEIACSLPRELAEAAEAFIQVHAKALALNQIGRQIGGGGSYGPDVMPMMVIRQLGPGWVDAQPIPFDLAKASAEARSALVAELKGEGFKVLT